MQVMRIQLIVKNCSKRIFNNVYPATIVARKLVHKGKGFVGENKVCGHKKTVLA